VEGDAWAGAGLQVSQPPLRESASIRRQDEVVGFKVWGVGFET
jgi:hypothetical protein